MAGGRHGRTTGCKLVAVSVTPSGDKRSLESDPLTTSQSMRRTALALGIGGVACAIIPPLAFAAIALGVVAVVLGARTRRKEANADAGRSATWSIALGAIACLVGVFWLAVFWIVSDAFSGF